MKSLFMKKLRRLNIATHRDLGYFFSSLIIIYCLSGFALNHVNDWNPDFIIEKETITIPGDYSTSNLSSELIKEFGKQVNETDYKVYDVPSPGKVKIYYDNASLLIAQSIGFLRLEAYQWLKGVPAYSAIHLEHFCSSAPF